ncbi:hypothetical protein [Blautia sp.]|jgi:hypothetical protein|uniref:hypothetical protein n=1 Tax=Blautia sp. TaxID=1955243 RepID=UPI00280B3D8E|nr:hypothetical protein [Blautia sp.]MDY3016819.1 hypothetical protein [Blautia sp.]MED9882859.1 hypothetical protein [Blautia sp.]
MDQENISQTALDQMVSSDQGQLLKAAVPYLPPQGQQMLSVYSKLQELFNTIRLFSPDRQGMQSCAAAASDPLEILQDLRRFSYGHSRQMLDRTADMIALIEIMKVINE